MADGFSYLSQLVSVLKWLLVYPLSRCCCRHPFCCQQVQLGRERSFVEGGAQNANQMVAELEHKESTDNDSYDSYDMFSEKEKKTAKPHVTTIQEYSQLVISCMQNGRRMNTTEVAKCILPFVSPKTTKLVFSPLSNYAQTVNVRRRVGDALSVLKAIHLVEKEGPSYVWIGTKRNHSSSRQKERTSHT